jgi:hypothetical protein
MALPTELGSTQDTKHMHNVKCPFERSSWPFFLALAAFVLPGCQSSKTQSSSEQKAGATSVAVTAAGPAEATTPQAASKPPRPEVLKPPVRIKAGATAAYTDSNGNLWLPDQGFLGGEVSDRPDDMEIANTKDPALYRSEHFSMDSFACKLPNGKYVVKLHFAETFEGIEGPGQRVFSFNVEGHAFKDFDVWTKAGGPRRAYIETVPVDITDGKLDISFQSGVENPEINGIEILPAP